MKKPVIKFAAWLLAAATAAAVIGGGRKYMRDREVRNALYAAFTPVRVTNCTLQRFGSAHDGGYLMCGNLLPAAQSAYSFDGEGADDWACEVAAAGTLTVHQYACGGKTTAACAGRSTVVHQECLASGALAGYVEKNGDIGKRLALKMDVDGAEWDALRNAPDSVLEAIDQMAVEFHGVEQPEFVALAERLNQFFYIAHVHYNNAGCTSGYEPFPGPLFEVLLVSKRLAVANPWVDVRESLPSQFDAPNFPSAPDCQRAAATTELQRVGRWATRWMRGGAHSR